MKRGPLISIIISTSLATWAAIYYFMPMSEATQMVVAALPLTALMWFGCYSLGTISYNMLSFRECPEAAAELQGEIKAAQKDLRKRGLKSLQ